MAGTLLRAMAAAAAASRVCFPAFAFRAPPPHQDTTLIGDCTYAALSSAINYVCAGGPEEQGALLAW